MAFVPFPSGVVQVGYRFLQGTNPAAVTMGMKFLSGAAAQSDGLALATQLENDWVTNWAPALSADLALLGVDVTDLTSSSGWTAAHPSTGAGTHSGNPVQSQVAMVITFQTPKRGRSFRGRNYYPGLPASDLADTATWSGGATGTFDTLYVNWAALLATLGWQHVVLSRVQGKVVLSLGEATPVTSYRANLKLGTIRGRLT